MSSYISKCYLDQFTTLHVHVKHYLHIWDSPQFSPESHVHEGISSVSSSAAVQPAVPLLWLLPPPPSPPPVPQL